MQKKFSSPHQPPAENSVPAAVRESTSSTPRSPASAAMGHCAGVEAGAAEPVAAWRYRNDLGEVTSEWIDGPVPEHVCDAITYERIATSEMKIDRLYARARDDKVPWSWDDTLSIANRDLDIDTQMAKSQIAEVRQISDAIDRHHRCEHEGGWEVSARDEFRKSVADTLIQWRHGCIPPRANRSVEAELFRSGIAEILSLRLRVAYMPLLQGLQRIEDRVNILTTVRAEPYASSLRAR